MSGLFECTVEELLGFVSPLFEAKGARIDKIPGLDDAQKSKMKAFFRKRPDLERRFDWNRPESVTWDSFSRLEDEYPEPIDPDTVLEFSDRRDEGDGIVSYEVEDSYRGQAAVRKIVDTHWGKDANPWCVVQTDGWGLTDSSMQYWDDYSALPKRIAFKNGKLVAFMAADLTLDDRMLSALRRSSYGEEFENDPDGEGSASFTEWMRIHYPERMGAVVTWWDRNDHPHSNLDFAR